MDPRLPWPADVPPPTLPPLVAETHGSGIALFGDAVVQALQFNAESDDVAPLPEEFKVPAAACGGADKWHQFVAACVRTVNGQPGGLLFNWFSLNTTEDGACGVQCLTCGGKPLSFGGGRDASSPFHNFTSRHLSSSLQKSKGYTFTYDAAPDSTPYSLENALGLVELALPRRDRYDLLDPSQGPRLDAALQLTKPSEKHGSKRTKGEEAQAEEARRDRQQYRPEDLGMRAPSGKARAPPTKRVRS